MVKRIGWQLVVAWVAVAALAHAAVAKDVQPEAGKVARPPVTPASLSTEQRQLAAEFNEFQGVLMKMRDHIRQTDPGRAALSEKALKESGERNVEGDFRDIVELLGHDKFGDAARKQDKVNEDLDAILRLLLSEDRSNRLLDKKAEIRKALEQINGIIRDQKDVYGRNVAGEDPKSLSGEQHDLAGRTGKLGKEMRDRAEAERGKQDPKADPKKDGKSDGKDGKSDSKDGKSDGKDGKDGKSGGKPDGKKSDKDPTKPKNKDDGNPKDPSAKNGDKNKPGAGDQAKADKSPPPSDSQGEGKKSKGQPSKGQPSQGQPGQEQDDAKNDPSQQDQNNPPNEQDRVQKRLQAAEQHMKDAKKKLDDAKRDGSLDEQKKALENLDQAKAELEEILRQLREEEMKRLLAMLEARFQKVLIIQKEIYEATVRLEKVPVAERSHVHEIETGRLSNREAEIVTEVEKALSLLHEEGSAVAMPLAVEQVRDDMQQLVHRLAEGKTEVLTQNIEVDVIRGLEDIIDSLKKAQKDAESKKKPPGPSPNGQPQDPPLIEELTELKMIRNLQLRVNRRTERYSKLITGEQADKDDVQDALQRLSEQQQKITKVTRDLELGKNE